MHSILYVDDEPLLLDITKRFLEMDKKLSVDTLESAEEALSVLNERSYDAVVSDYQMPRMDGIEFLKELRRSGNDIPFIIFTGRGREDVVIEAFESGADFYLQKGGDPKVQFTELVHKINQAISRHKAEKALAESEMRFRSIVENSPDLIIQRDAKGFAVYVSPSSEKIMGYKPEELIGEHFSDFLGSEQAEEVVKHNTPLTSGVKPGPILLKIRKKDGSFAYLESSAVLLNGKDYSGGVQTISRDISFRREAEEKIKAKDELYRSLAETVPGMIYTIDTEGRIIYLNNSAASGLGKKPEEVLGKTIFEIFPKDQAEGHMKAIQEILKSGKPLYREMLEKLPSGDLWVGVSLSPIRNNDGIITGVLGVSYDINSRKLTEEALRKSEIQYAETLDAMTDAISVVDRDLKFLLANKAFRELSAESGFDVPDNIYGLRMREVLHFLPAVVFDEYEKVFSEGKQVSGEEEVILPDRTVYVFSKKIPVFSGDEVVKVVTVIRDITNEKKTQADLRESGEYIRVLFESAKDAIFIKNRNFEYTHVNPYLCKVYGMDRDYIIGKTDKMLFGNESPDIIRNSDLEVLEGKTSSYDVNYWIRGEKSYFSVVKVPIFAEDGSVTGICGIARDISIRRHTEEALALVNRKVNLLSKITRHDLLNKITAIMGYCELMKDETDGNDSIERLIEREEASLDEMMKIIEFLKKYDSVESETARWLSLQTEIREYIKYAEKNGISVTVELKGLEIYTDPIFIRIFSDLVNNSVMHGCGVSEIKISRVDASDHVVIKYEDNGCGIPRDQKEKIFLKGFGKGTGLGLFYIREILGVIEMSILETGEEGKGAIFEIRVPADFCRFSEQK